MESLVAPWLDAPGQAAFYRQIAQADQAYTDEIEGLYPTVDLPVLVVWGRDDAWIPVDRAQRLFELIPGAQLELIDNAGHLSTSRPPSPQPSPDGSWTGRRLGTARLLPNSRLAIDIMHVIGDELGRVETDRSTDAVAPVAGGTLRLLVKHRKCADGTYVHRTGQIGTEGTYHLDPSLSSHADDHPQRSRSRRIPRTRRRLTTVTPTGSTPPGSAPGKPTRTSTTASTPHTASPTSEPGAGVLVE